MPDENEIRIVAASQLGHISRPQVRALGGRYQRMAASSEWVRVTDRVLRLVGASRMQGERAMAAVLDEGPGAVLSHAGAAAWWGLGGFSLRQLDLTRVGERVRHTEMARVHEVRSLPSDWATVHQGIPVVRPELLIMQLCATVHPHRAARSLDNAWRDRLLSGPSLIRFLDDHAARGRNGIALLRELVEERGADYVPAGSNIESRVQQLFMVSPVSFRRQVDLGGETWNARVDFMADDAPLVLEVQSEKYHSSLSDHADDLARFARLADAGFAVIEITDEELFTLPQMVVDRVLEAWRRLRRSA